MSYCHLAVLDLDCARRAYTTGVLNPKSFDMLGCLVWDVYLLAHLFRLLCLGNHS